MTGAGFAIWQQHGMWLAPCRRLHGMDEVTDTPVVNPASGACRQRPGRTAGNAGPVGAPYIGLRRPKGEVTHDMAGWLLSRSSFSSGSLRNRLCRDAFVVVSSEWSTQPGGHGRAGSLAAEVVVKHLRSAVVQEASL